MFVKMLETLGTCVVSDGVMLRGKVYDIPDAHGAQLVRAKLAERTTMPPEWIAEVLNRLDDGAGRPCLFLPPYGMEFGHEVMTPVRIVQFHKASRKIVCCRPGTEVLYPAADEFVTDWLDTVPDAQRVGTFRDQKPPEWPELLARFPDHHPVQTGGFTLTQELYAIEPDKPIPMRPKLRGLRADVAIGVRARDFCPERNWPREHYQIVADAITRAGLTFAVVGRRDTSFDLNGQQFHTGDYDTDAAVELLQTCRLFVGPDSGASHLASTVGVPMIIFRHHGSRQFVDRMAQVNRYGIEFLPDAWGKPAAVAAAVVNEMEFRHSLDRNIARLAFQSPLPPLPSFASITLP